MGGCRRLQLGRGGASGFGRVVLCSSFKFYLLVYLNYLKLTSGTSSRNHAYNQPTPAT